MHKVIAMYREQSKQSIMEKNEKEAECMVTSIVKIITESAHKSRAGFMLLISLLVISGCATGSGPKTESKAELMPGAKIIQPGDTADIRFLCRIGNGDVVAATDMREMQGMPRSRVFLPHGNNGSEAITAVASGSLDAKERTFEEEITGRLAGMLAGMKEGEGRRFELTAQDLPERDLQNFVVSIPRVRIRSKEMRMPKGDYEFHAGKSPEVGQAFSLDPAFPGHVESFTDQEVVLRFKADPGTRIETPFGTGRILEDENNYKVEIAAVQGALVRTGPFVGRITEVDAQNITIDYRHPFGRETLTCDVTIEKVSKAKPITSAAGK